MLTCVAPVSLCYTPFPPCSIDFHTVDAPESSTTPKPSQPLSVSRLAASLKSRLAGSFSAAVNERESPVVLSEVDTGRQLIEAAKVRRAGL